MGKIRASIRRMNMEILGQERYVRRPMTYSVINSDDLIKLAAEDSKMSVAVLRQVFDGMRMQFAELLLNGHSLQMGELGTFRLSINAKSVHFAEQVSVEKIKKRHIIFTPSPSLKQELENTSIETVFVQGFFESQISVHGGLSSWNGKTATLMLSSSFGQIAKHLKVTVEDEAFNKYPLIIDDTQGTLKVNNKAVGSIALSDSETPAGTKIKNNKITFTITDAASGYHIDKLAWS